jgi:DNA polymerase-4
MSVLRQRKVATMRVNAQAIRRVAHCDLDCFFAAVEELDDPSLRGRPVIVGGDPHKRGVVSTANYVARRYGVHSAMAASLARRLCPQAVFLRPRFERYRDLSRQVMAILDDYFLVMEQVSVDEAYGELAPATRGGEPAERIAEGLRARVSAETGLAISVGVARSKSIAKLASDACKPDGLLVIPPTAERAFLDPLPVSKLNGVGPHTRARLERLGLRTVGEIARTDPLAMQRALGKHGLWLWRLANAQDDRQLEPEHGPPKSVSHEDTYERDIADLERASERIREQTEIVARRVRAKRLVGRTVQLKVKWWDFTVVTRQRGLSAPTDDAEVIAATAIDLLRAEIAPTLYQGNGIRLLGVGLHGIEPRDGWASAGGIAQLPLWALDAS